MPIRLAAIGPKCCSGNGRAYALRYGAEGYSKLGYTAARILEHYYPGALVTRLEY